MSTSLHLRPYRLSDLPLQPSDSEYDDFGPQASQDVPPPCDLAQDGRLAVVATEEGGEVVVGGVGWHWVSYGPGTASRTPMLGISLTARHRGRGYGTRARRGAYHDLVMYSLLRSEWAALRA